MSGSKPKIKRGGASKIKNIMGSRIDISRFAVNSTGVIQSNVHGKTNCLDNTQTIILVENNSLIEKYLNATTADEQLEILKTILEKQRESADANVVQFLAVVFYEAPSKHPMKSFLVRHITKCPTIEEPFTKTLTAHINSEIKRDQHENVEFSYYLERVPKIMMCIENFPAGALAVESLNVELLTLNLFYNYFVGYRESLFTRKRTLSPTEKNEMFSLEHVMLRLIVHVLQSMQILYPETLDSTPIYQYVIKGVQILILDEEVPMDTKSLSGILIIRALCVRYNLQLPDACLMLLKSDEVVGDVQHHKHGKLVVYCAIATMAPLQHLQEPLNLNVEQSEQLLNFTKLEENAPAVTVLLDNLLGFADGNASEPAVAVAVARALLQLSRSLPTLDDVMGGRVTSRLLPFVWAHLEYHLDSVRHLTQQILANCLDYCVELEKTGVTKPLYALLSSVRKLGEKRSLYWAVSRACASLGATRVLQELCTAHALLQAANESHLQAAATAAITAVLSSGACAGLAASDVYATWVAPALDSPAVLQAVLPAATELCPTLVQYVSHTVSGHALLCCARACPHYRACVTHRALRAAATTHDDETRILALSLVCERDRTTEIASREDLDTVSWFLRYNLACPQPSFRTSMLHYVNKLLKRLEDSHRLHSRREEPELEYYSEFIHRTRELCFNATLRGANHARRTAALQLLASVDNILPHVIRVWKPEYVTSLLEHLDDSYDTNKEFALQVLKHCPLELLESNSSELTLEAVLHQAGSLRAAAGAAAAVKLHLLLTRLPLRIVSLQTDYHGQQEFLPLYCLLQALVQQLHKVAELSPWQEAARGGAAATLHCLAYLLTNLPFGEENWQTPQWRDLEAELTQACLAACQRAEPVVASDAPEGFVPDYCELGGQEVKVTAQMVLVCAWRTIKEGAAVLSLLAPRSETSCALAGDYLVGLLKKALHRGAVDQAAAGLYTLAQRCWEKPSHSDLPRQWLRQLLALVGGGAPHATRRGAGLPAAIQALVASEVSATGRAECFSECMTELLQLAAGGDCGDATHHTSDTTEYSPNAAPDDGKLANEAVARRTLAANILRALFRNCTLDRVSQVYVAAGIRLAVRGFEAAAWPERTAMSLLFCALTVRIFGVARARGTDVHSRNTLPAKLFFQRYPGIYDLMLSKLQGFAPGSAAGPAVLPVLLMLARLYPATADGAASSLKVCAFVPLVQRCACASELRIRRLAARALPALLPPSDYLPYIERLLSAVSQPNILRNHWHGALLTLTSLIERAPTAIITRRSYNTPNGTLKASNRSLKNPDGSTKRSDESSKNPDGSPNSSDEPSKNPDGSTKSSDESSKNPDGSPNSSDEPSKNPDGSTKSSDEYSKNPDGSTKSSDKPSKHHDESTKWSVVSHTICALTQATRLSPCYVIAREYVNVFNLLVWRFPEMVDKESIANVLRVLDTILFSGESPLGPDREPCLADCLLLYVILLHREGQVDKIVPLILNTLQHTSYEVVLATLDYVLITHEHQTDIDQCNLKRHLYSIRDITILETLRKSNNFEVYVKILGDIFHNTEKYPECRQKCLELLTLENDTQMIIIGEDLSLNNNQNYYIAMELVERIENCHELMRNHFLESLLKLMSVKLSEMSRECILKVFEIVYKCCSGDNDEETRLTVVRYLERDVENIVEDWSVVPLQNIFLYKSLIISMLVTLLEDDDDEIRQRAGDVTIRLTTHRTSERGNDVHNTAHYGDRIPFVASIDDETALSTLKQALCDNQGSGLIVSACAELLRAYIEGIEDGAELLLVLALLDFNAEVCLTDELNEECRVFDQSERYNILLEESTWTSTCAERINTINHNCTNLTQYALSTIQDTKYSTTFNILCRRNIQLFRKMATGEFVNDETLNPKIEILVRKLRG